MKIKLMKPVGGLQKSYYIIVSMLKLGGEASDFFAPGEGGYVTFIWVGGGLCNLSVHGINSPAPVSHK